MPRNIPPSLLPFINSNGYPSLPRIEDLESIRSALIDYSTSFSRPVPPSADEAALKARREKKRKEREEEERAKAAVDANEKAGLRLEAVERAKLQGHVFGAGAMAQVAGKKKGVVAGKDSPGVKVKRERTSLSPAPSNASTSMSFKQPPQTYGSQVKKKKIKRVIDSDDEHAHSRDRSAALASPPPHQHPHQSSTSGLKLKLSHPPKARPSISLDSPSPSFPVSGPGSHFDFSLPPQPAKPLIPVHAGPRKPMPAGPKKQSEVDEDYSNKRAPNQVAFPTFWGAVEPYLRDIREDDLAMLGFKTDPPESYEVPPKGRHYTEIWDEEDGNAPGTRTRVSVPNLRQQQMRKHIPSAGLSLPHFVPAQEIKDENLYDEQRGLGGLTERIVAAVFDLGKPDPEAARAEQLTQSGGEELKIEPAKVDVVDLEERMKKELKAVMLLGEHEEYDPSNRDDDEISSSLRQCQRLLAAQTSLNDARKSRLVELAKQRLAYFEYRHALDGVEKSIEEAWAKRLKKYGISPKKGYRPGDGGTVVGDNGEVVPLNVSGRPPVPDTLKRLVDTRKSWLGSVGKVVKERPRGELVGIPGNSVYEGLEEKIV